MLRTLENLEVTVTRKAVPAIALTLCCTLTTLLAAAAPPPEPTFSNADVLSLVKAGFGKEVVISKIRSAPVVAFDLTTADLVALKKSGLPDEVVTAMIERMAKTTTAPTGKSEPGAAIAPLPGQPPQKQGRFSKLKQLGMGMRAVGESDTCPAPGTFVEFARLSSPGTSDDFSGCDVTTTVEFVASGAGSYVVQSVPSDAVIFRALPPGAHGERNPLSGEIQSNFIAIEKAKADLVFRLGAGERLTLRGGTRISKMLLGGSYQQVLFVATAIERVK